MVLILHFSTQALNVLYTTCLIHTHIHTVCLFVFLYWSTFYLTFRHLHCHPTGFKPTWEPPNKQEGDCVYLRASIHTWGNWGDGTHQRLQVNLIRKQCTSHQKLSKKTRNKETETQTYKLDAKKEYEVFVGGGEGFFFPCTFGSENKSWLFTFHWGYLAY